MRLLAALTLVLTACTSQFSDAGIRGMGDSPIECMTSADCVAGAAKCCDCPTYAAPKNDSAISGCSGVMCPQMNCPMNVAPSCNANHQCELACVAIACTNTCDDGFAVDANGCLSCECAQVGARECIGDNNCAEAPKDCCGCAKGGADTSVPADQLATYEASLDCSTTPACPGNNTCDATMQPACVQGTCALVPALAADACGRTDLPACTGGVCVINMPGGNPAYSDHRVGVCTQTLP